jgi:hypothetical protein
MMRALQLAFWSNTNEFTPSLLLMHHSYASHFSHAEIWNFTEASERAIDNALIPIVCLLLYCLPYHETIVNRKIHSTPSQTQFHHSV